jgi:flagellar protein FlaE
LGFDACDISVNLNDILALFGWGSPEDDEPAEEEVIEPQDTGKDESVEELKQTIKTFQSELNELTTEQESNSNAVKRLRSDLDNVTEDMTTMDDRVRKLLGFYDALAARVNPLVKGDFRAVPILNAMDKADSESPFKLDEEPEYVDGLYPDDEVDTEAASRGVDENDHSQTGETDDTQHVGTSEDHDEAVEKESDLETDDTVRTVEDIKRARESSETHQGDKKSDEDTPHMHALPGSYGGELLALEWLAALVERSGTAGALRALSYYESIGWVSPMAKRALQRRLMGAAEPVGQSETTEVLDAEDHTMSLAYVVQLEELLD